MAMAYFEIKWAQSNLVLIQETTNWTMIWNQMALVQNIDPGNKKCLYNDLKLDGNGILWNLMGSTESSSEHWSRKQRTAWTSGRRPFVHICCCDLSHRLRKGWCQAYDLAPWKPISFQIPMSSKAAHLDVRLPTDWRVPDSAWAFEVCDSTESFRSPQKITNRPGQGGCFSYLTVCVTSVRKLCQLLLKVHTLMKQIITYAS